jgi:hypothetical protein
MGIAMHTSFRPHNDRDAALVLDDDTRGAEVVREPTEQPYGVHGRAVRDPAGNLIRIQELA